jgi:copper homeostasis protein CutC
LLLEEIIELRDRFKMNGVVVGGLEQQSEQLLIDTAFMEAVVRECSGKTRVTFHKASDLTPDLSQAILSLQKLGVDEVLTQGGRNSIVSM